MQVTLYIDNKSEVLAKAAAAANGVSLSRWVSGAIQDKTLNTWPKAVLDAAGAFPDWPEVDCQSGVDAPRETWD